MPTYQYACTQCEHRFEQVQSFSDASLTECPVCGGKLRKVYGSVGVVFKGSGFYRTDSRNGASGTSAAEKSDSGDKAKTAKESAPTKSADSSGSSSSSTSTSTSAPAAGSTPAAKPAAAAKSSSS